MQSPYEASKRAASKHLSWKRAVSLRTSLKRLRRNSLFPSPRLLIIVLEKPTILVAHRTIEVFMTTYKFFRDVVFGTEIVVVASTTAFIVNAMVKLAVETKLLGPYVYRSAFSFRLMTCFWCMTDNFISNRNSKC